MSANLPGSFTVDIEGFPEKLTSNLLISSPTLLPETLREAARKVSIASEDSIKQESIVRGILIMDHAIVFEALETEQNDYEEEQEIDEDSSPSPTRPTDTAVLIFPPSSFDGCRDDAAVTVFIAGEGSMSTPRGKCEYLHCSILCLQLNERLLGIAYLSLPLSLTGDTVSAEGVLKPYVNKLISLCAPPNGATSVTEPLFSTYYIQKHQESHLSQFDESSLVGTQPSPVLVTPPVPTSLTDSSDITVTAGEALFWAAVKSLKARGIIPRNTEGRQNDVIDSVWPPLDSTGDDDD
jgi:Rab proteins geranylgeranyltransferase component A